MIEQPTLSLSRRQFIVSAGTSGAALVLGMTLPLNGSADAAYPDEVNAWVVVQADDTVIIRIARSEMGQGTVTGLAQLVAEELECDWDKVTWDYPTPGQSLARNRVWGSFATGGSYGIRGSQQYVREGGAAARMMLLAAAANQWRVPVEECSAANSQILHQPSGRKTSFGTVAAAAAQLPLPEKITLKDPKDWRVIGQSIKRLDTRDKLTGKQIYGSDISLPGMLVASIRACPVFGGKVASFDAKKVSSMPGVKAVLQVEDNAVAVVADSWWRANKALLALPVEWDKGANATVSQAQINTRLAEGLTAQTAFVGNQSGDCQSALAKAKTRIEASYNHPFLNHATMEPMNATALWREDSCEVWCPTQNGEAALAATAAAAGLAPEQCEVHKVLPGGGFGRRGRTDYVTQAVRIAKQMPGIPVKLLWSREEDMKQGSYHPITMARLEGGLDDDGNLVALHLRISGPSIVAALRPESLQHGKDMAVFQGLLPKGDHAISYDIPNLLVDHALRETHVPPGFWRGVNVNQNAIYIECFIDELAHAAGQDPLAFRQRLMRKNPKGLAVLNAAAQGAGWGSPAPEGVYRGLASFYAFGSYVAACAEVCVDNKGKLIMHRIVAATDPGYAVNPQQIEAQVEGSFVYGLSALLYEECTVKDGEIEQDNFDSFPSMLIAQMPEVKTIVMPSGGFWGGVGEPTIAVAAPAVLNAIYAATGKRIRNLPLKDTDLRAAMPGSTAG